MNSLVKKDNENSEVLKWERVRGVVTPGGDPCFICPACRDKDSEHISGIEHPVTWNYCPVCGIKLSYW